MTLQHMMHENAATTVLLQGVEMKPRLFGWKKENDQQVWSIFEKSVVILLVQIFIYEAKMHSIILTLLFHLHHALHQNIENNWRTSSRIITNKF